MTSGFQHIRLHTDGHLATVQLHRPAARNAMSVALMRELTAAAHALAERTDIDAVLLTGDATCFTAGADLKDTAGWANEALSLVERREIAGVGWRL